MINDKNIRTLYISIYKKLSGRGVIYIILLNFRIVPIMTRGVRNVKNLKGNKIFFIYYLQHESIYLLLIITKKQKTKTKQKANKKQTNKRKKRTLEKMEKKS
jgi:hypothetical protein